MNKSKSLAILAAVASLAAIPTASAQNVTCDNANFSEEVMNIFAGIRNSCLAIVDRGGEPHALLNAEVTKVSPPYLSVRFKRRDGGYTSTIRLQPADDHVFTIQDNKKVTYKDLTQTSQLRVYVPAEAPMGRIGFEVDPMTGELRYFDINDE